MRALLCEGPTGRLSKEHPLPERHPGEARVSVRVAGVCDTDLQLLSGYMGYRGVLGHEFVGRVLEADDAALVGQRVVADINAGCGRCDDCRAGGGHHCRTRTVLGILGRDGALAEQLVVPARSLVPVPDAVGDDRAVFAEPLAAALHVLDELDGESDAIVLGDGKLGLLIALALRSAEVDVLLVGHHREKLALAEAAGARTCLESELPRSEAAVVVEATGSATGLRRALSLTAPRGKLVLKTTVSGSIDVDLSPVVINELQLIGSRCGDLSRAVDVLAAGRLDPSSLIAARYSLDQAEQAVAHAARKGTLKVLVDVEAS